MRADGEGKYSNAGGAASAWRRRRRRLSFSFLALPFRLASSYQRRAGSKRGGDAYVTDGEKSANTYQRRATDGQRQHFARLE